MIVRSGRVPVWIIVLLAGGTWACPGWAATVQAAEAEAFFERKVRPVLAGTCFKCHGGERLGGKLRIDSREALLKGGRSGPALVPGAPERSLLIQAIRYHDDTLHMPPAGPLAPEVVADFVAWVQTGAVWPKTAAAGGDKAFVSRHHWAFEPLRPVQPPSGAGEAGTNSIDLFLAAKWGEKGLTPAAPAERRTLIRRATFDLLGLPPTPEEVEAFVADQSPDAFARLLDQLLASPHYGERWGRHWLDVVRYADTAGETADFPIPDARRYRNYVIDAFNQDKPYNQFLREQLAGDILARQLPATAPPERYAELVVATGYLAIARRFGFDIVADKHLTIEDTIDVLGKSVLGMTVGCARCHDHKYDPITTADYYALYGIFDSTRYPFSGCEKNKVPRDMVPLTPAGKANRAVEVAYAVVEDRPHHAPIQKRGDPTMPGEIVPRRFLEVFGGQPVSAPATGSGRLQLAEWLTSPNTPVTARVMVNRIWQHHFGTGLVKTPNDFGTRGSPPSHPELLEYLANRFIESGWSVKAMHRLIMLSRAYQRGSGQHARSTQLDPDNVWLSRFARRRLSAEEIRDAVLAVSGDLDRTPGGPHPFPPQKSWGFTQHAPFAAVYDHNRRSIYLMTQRIKRHPFLALFDGADASASTAERFTTTVPTQALFFMNDPFMHAKSASFAGRLLALTDDRARQDRAFRLVYGRSPNEEEQRSAARFLEGYAADLAAGTAAERQRQAWAAWLRVLLASNEFLFVD